MQKNKFVECCNEQEILKQKDMLENWDNSLIQVQLNYFAPCCNKCNKKSPSIVKSLEYPFQDVIKSYWISLRSLILKRDEMISLMNTDSDRQSLHNSLHAAMKDVLLIVQRTSNMKPDIDYNQTLVNDLSKILNNSSNELYPCDVIHISTIDDKILRLVLRKNIIGIEK